MERHELTYLEQRLHIKDSSYRKGHVKNYIYLLLSFYPIIHCLFFVRVSFTRFRSTAEIVLFAPRIDNVIRIEFH